jgi:electron transfer flavoprotein beta subunit
VKIAVCVKQVPDSWAEKKMAGQVLDRASADAVLNDLDEYAIEEALKIIEANSPTNEAGEGSGHTLTLISMGPERASEAVRKGLSMGADDAILITDAALAGADALATSLVLSKVIAENNFDLVLCGAESTDARMSVVPSMLAERLGFAQLTCAAKVEVGANKVEISRSIESGIEKQSANYPVLLGVVEKINEPRYPSFKGIMAAKKKTITTKSLSDLGLTSDQVKPWSVVKDVKVLPARGAGIKVEDSGDAGNKLADFLAEKKLI